MADSKSNSSTRLPRSTTTRVSSGWVASISILFGIVASHEGRARVRCCGAGCGVPGKGCEAGKDRMARRPTGTRRRPRRCGLAAGKRACLVCYRPPSADRPLNWIGNAQARRLDSAERFARAANGGRKPSSGHPSRGAADRPHRLIRFGWVDREAPLGRVACPYAAEPETSNLQRLLIYGVSPGMASRNFRAHRRVGITERYSATHMFHALLFLPRIGGPSGDGRTGAPKHTAERNGGSLQDRLTMGILVGVQRSAGGEGLEIWW